MGFQPNQRQRREQIGRGFRVNLMGSEVLAPTACFPHDRLLLSACSLSLCIVSESLAVSPWICISASLFPTSLNFLLLCCSLFGSRVLVNMRTGVTGRVTHSDGEYSLNMTSWHSLLASDDSWQHAATWLEAATRPVPTSFLSPVTAQSEHFQYLLKWIPCFFPFSLSLNYRNHIAQVPPEGSAN